MLLFLKMLHTEINMMLYWKQGHASESFFRAKKCNYLVQFDILLSPVEYMVDQMQS